MICDKESIKTRSQLFLKEKTVFLNYETFYNQNYIGLTMDNRMIIINLQKM